MSKLLFGILSLTIFLTACEDPAANKPKATTTNTSNTASTSNTSNASNTAVAPATSETLVINPENSKVEFVGSKVTGKHDGGFKKFAGTIALMNGKPEDSTVSIDLDMNSVFTDADGLTKHLMTGDFFDVAKYPKATFKATKIVPDTEKGAGNYMVTGDLTLRGVTKSVTFPAKIAVSDGNVAVNAEFSINRKDFNILYAGKADDLIRDDVVIKLDLEAPRKK
jgi:polyisoprenoid-binding protein YceI